MQTGKVTRKKRKRKHSLESYLNNNLKIEKRNFDTKFLFYFPEYIDTTKIILYYYSINCTTTINTEEVPMLQLDYKDHRPLYEQIKEKMKVLIMSGVLKSDQQLPSVRELAQSLTINPNTIQKAYKDLETEGFIYSVIIFIIATFFIRSISFSRLTFIYYIIVGIPILITFRFIMNRRIKRMFESGIGVKRLLFIDLNEANVEIITYLKEHREFGIVVEGGLSADGEEREDIDILGKIENYKSIIDAYSIDIVLLRKE
jgi:hypothetical protein